MRKVIRTMRMKRWIGGSMCASPLVNGAFDEHGHVSASIALHALTQREHIAASLCMVLSEDRTEQRGASGQRVGGHREEVQAVRCEQRVQGERRGDGEHEDDASWEGRRGGRRDE